MILTPDNHPPCRLVDGDGHEIIGVTKIDLETGRTERYTLDEGGFAIEYAGELVRHVEYLPLPISVLPASSSDATVSYPNLERVP